MTTELTPETLEALDQMTWTPAKMRAHAQEWRADRAALAEARRELKREQSWINWGVALEHMSLRLADHLSSLYRSDAKLMVLVDAWRGDIRDEYAKRQAALAASGKEKP